ncbi:MAG: glycosyltransferase family 2 protein [Anaerolineales bacterium]|nr:glycosyltransferase family 2 protein [Anaerolineales bacterium]
MDLSIIIVNWNTSHLLERCLNEICLYPPSCSFEVFVIDNASTDDSVFLLKTKFAWVHLIENQENVGFAKANNQAIWASAGEYVLLLNSDAFVQPDALQYLLNNMRANPDTGVCGPMLLNDDQTFQASFADFPSLWHEIIHQLGLAKYLISPNYPSYAYNHSLIQQKVDWVGGACMMVRRQAIVQAGMLNESFLMYGEEMEWCYRIKQCGWQIIFCPDAKVTHLGGQSSTAIPDWKYIQIQKGKVLFFAQSYSKFSAKALEIIIRLINFAKMIVCFVYKQFHNDAEQRFHVYWKVARAKLL